MILVLSLTICLFYPSLKDAYKKRNAVYLTEEYISLSNKTFHATSIEVQWKISWGPTRAQIVFEYQDLNGNWQHAKEKEISIAEKCTYATPNGELTNIRILAKSVANEYGKINGFAQFDIQAKQ